MRALFLELRQSEKLQVFAIEGAPTVPRGIEGVQCLQAQHPTWFPRGSPCSASTKTRDGEDIADLTKEEDDFASSTSRVVIGFLNMELHQKVPSKKLLSSRQPLGSAALHLTPR